MAGLSLKLIQKFLSTILLSCTGKMVEKSAKSKRNLREISSILGIFTLSPAFSTASMRMLVSKAGTTSSNCCYVDCGEMYIVD